jgi:hypothetical protein
MATKRTLLKAAVAVVAGTLGALSAIKTKDERYVDGIWQTLEQVPADHRVFTESMVAELPEAARRYFLHAIRPGTPLATRLRWRYTAQMKPGASLPWMPLVADQVLVRQRGFVWKATAHKGPLFVTVRDHYLDGEGRMRIALLGLIPVINATGSDLSKSAMARLVIEGVTLLSSFLPGPNVEISGIDDSRFTVTTHLHGEATPITITVDADGRPTEVTMLRWGNLTPDGSYQAIPYGMKITGERTFGGYTIPSQVAGGWWYGTQQYLEVIQLHVDWAHLD